MANAVEVHRFACEKCGRLFQWKLELAGKSATCTCGAKMQVPREEPGDEDYDLAPIPVEPVKPITTLRPSTGLAYATPKTSATPGVDAYIFDQTKDLHIPLALIAAGTLVSFGEVLFRFPYGTKSVSSALIMICAGLVIETVIMLAGLFIAAKVRGLAFGPFWIAVMKLCAISLAPGAAFTLVKLALTPFGVLGTLLAWLGSFILYFALFGVLFDLDESDTWFCVILIFVLKLLTAFVVIRAMM